MNNQKHIVLSPEGGDKPIYTGSWHDSKTGRSISGQEAHLPSMKDRAVFIPAVVNNVRFEYDTYGEDPETKKKILKHINNKPLKRRKIIDLTKIENKIHNISYHNNITFKIYHEDATRAINRKSKKSFTSTTVLLKYSPCMKAENKELTEKYGTENTQNEKIRYILNIILNEIEMAKTRVKSFNNDEKSNIIYDKTPNGRYLEKISITTGLMNLYAYKDSKYYQCHKIVLVKNKQNMWHIMFDGEYNKNLEVCPDTLEFIQELYCENVKK